MGGRSEGLAFEVPEGLAEPKSIVITVPGKVRGKGRPRSAPLMRNGKPVLGHGGRPIVTHHTDEETAAYESLIRLAGQKAMDGRPPMTGPLMLNLVARFRPIDSWSDAKRRAAILGVGYKGKPREYPTKKPDKDNITKAVCDGLNSVVYVDDVQIVQGWIEKTYSDIDGLQIEITALT